MGRYSGYDDARAVCPYYKGGTATEVRCDGIECGHCIIVRFKGKTERNGFRARHCDNISGFKQCPLKKAHE